MVVTWRERSKLTVSHSGWAHLLLWQPPAVRSPPQEQTLEQELLMSANNAKNDKSKLSEI